MKRSEAIRKYYDAIAAEMIEDYELVLKSRGNAQYKIYVWEDGEIEYLQGVQGDNTMLAPRSAETRELFYVTTVDAPMFDPWDFAEDAAPDDDAEREAAEEEIIKYLVDEYRRNISDQIDPIIDEAEMQEEY